MTGREKRALYRYICLRIGCDFVRQDGPRGKNIISPRTFFKKSVGAKKKICRPSFYPRKCYRFTLQEIFNISLK